MGWGEGRTPAFPPSLSPSTDRPAAAHKNEPYEVENRSACDREKYSGQGERKYEVHIGVTVGPGIHGFSPLSQASVAPRPQSPCPLTPASGSGSAINEPSPGSQQAEVTSPHCFPLSPLLRDTERKQERDRDGDREREHDRGLRLSSGMDRQGSAEELPTRGHSHFSGSQRLTKLSPWVHTSFTLFYPYPHPFLKDLSVANKPTNK